MFNRRAVLKLLCGTAVVGTIPNALVAEEKAPLLASELRGSLDASKHNFLPNSVNDQSSAFNQLLKLAAKENRTLYLPAGNYYVSNITLPDGIRIQGVPGATKLIYDGGEHFISCNKAHSLSLRGLSFDGANRWINSFTQAAVDLRGIENLTFFENVVLGSAKNALSLERCGGRIEKNVFSGAARAAIYAVESHHLSINDNHIHDCANGGILVHRWQKGIDQTVITNNRIERINATSGGTGQNGNGINVFRADQVMVTNNHISNCAFSAIRFNSGSNALIANNQCFKSGETALYCEFSFTGSVISANLIDGAANGISVANFNEGGRLATITGNIIRNLNAPEPYPPEGPGFGWGIAVEADCVVTGNIVEGAPKWGMLLGWGTYLRSVVASNNIIRDCGLGIAVSVAKGAGNALISGNTFQNALKGAIVGHEWQNPVTKDLSKNQDRYKHLKISNNQVL